MKLTKKGYTKYPKFLDKNLIVINEDENRVRVRARGAGEAWIEKGLIAKESTKKEAPVETEEQPSE